MSKKVLFYGQATGGNALIWFELFNNMVEANDPISIEMLARTECTLTHDFKVYKAYGSKSSKGFFTRLKKALASKFTLPLYLEYLKNYTKYDLLVLQGNYTPENNLKVLNKINYNTSLLNIYGSDFISKWPKVKNNTKLRSAYCEVLDKVDFIVFNWYSTFELFLKEFPEFSGKLKLFPWGIQDQWWDIPQCKIEKDQLNFLSTRALHAYNNVDKVVESFCIAFPSPSKNMLKVISAYGHDERVYENIINSIKKYSMEDRVTIEIDKWYEGRELMALYDNADYNLCFGNYDQLTVSITYAISRGVTNILSPIDSYKYLYNFGIKSPIICDAISIDSLVKAFSDVDTNNIENTHLDSDFIFAKKTFNHRNTLDNYLGLIKNES
ncbi:MULTISPECIES: hypothetical protein [Pseudoalteromonas]|uniref:hypothetical protein n=1 Tax=Pseudoalteromonas TaxID=53246 RepID=UPI0002EB62E6|nr:MULTISPECIES: hypothetical protein [Pseudoalteromonas]MCF6145991.1 hypothetical protein [Pseudoalteromonas mariniglutinosa NCIMB 1770]